MLHPMGGDDFAALVSENLTPWLAVHYGAAVLFPLMGYVIWVLIRDLRGRAATVARIAIPVYAVFYGAYEAVMGIATGVMTQQGDGMTGASATASPRPSTPSRPTRSSATAGCSPPSAASPGSPPSRARSSPSAPRASAPPALVLLGIGTFMAIHIPPIGPIALRLPQRRRADDRAPSAAGGDTGHMKRIGLLGGMSWESSAEYYRLVNEATRDRLGGLHSADCLMRSVDFTDVEVLQRGGRWDEAGALLARRGERARRRRRGADRALHEHDAQGRRRDHRRGRRAVRAHRRHHRRGGPRRRPRHRRAARHRVHDGAGLLRRPAARPPRPDRARARARPTARSCTASSTTSCASA